MNKYQKDWIIGNFKTGNLLCATIESKDGKEYSLTEWVNFYNLITTELHDMIDLGYMTMLEAAKKVPNYNYTIANHNFSKKDFIANKYFNSLLDTKNVYGKSSFSLNSIPVDKKEFEKQINSLKHKLKYSR